MNKILTLATIMIALATASAFGADAKENWEKHCAKCHGADGKGQTVMGKKLKVKDYTVAAEQKTFTDADALKLLKEGKKEGDKTIKKSFAGTLTEEELTALVKFTREFAK